MTEQDELIDELIEQRKQVYGDPIETFARVAQMWSGLIGHEIQACEVPLMMAAYKMLRTQVCPEYSDNSDDIDGYMDIFRTVVGEDMIQARSVEEFIAKRQRLHTVVWEEPAGCSDE
jgi:hypothetical protein